MMTSGGSGSGLAAGVSVSVIVILALVGIAIFFLLRRRRGERWVRDRASGRSRDDHTRVVLTAPIGEGDYINANYITGYNNKKHAYIACQGPRDITIEDMWRMVWQEKSNTIVMLANLVENGKDGRLTWGHFIAERVIEEKVADYVVRQFSLRNEETGEVRRIRQLHFTSWPDRGTPQYAYPLLAFRRKVHSFDRAIRGPLVVHCSAGVGRTGTFMAIDILIQQAAAEGKIDVFQCIDQLRTQRMNMVQTLDQYVFVYQAMIESSQATVVPCSTLRQTFDELCRSRQIEQQFEVRCTTNQWVKKVKCAALEPNNRGKNRDIAIIPDDQHRPYLLTRWQEGTNYINAVFVHSPMESTVVDLWRLLADHESRTVVMLDDCDISDDQCATYWPLEEGTAQQFGPFQVELMQTVVSATSFVTVREFNVTKSKEETPTVVKQFQLMGVWSQGASLPSNKTVVLELLGLLEKWQQMSGNGPVTVHCSNGASRCGLLCAASYVLEQLKLEQEVDVFHAVQHVRTTRPQLVTDTEQYRFLYEIALEYMSQYDEYANFR
ncbi:hypothetical protein NP493_723g02053 [Ridgeia piscesae]|uniref:protein-tyrosine-phosphatase n=1 Tax=Ridgeia piscesae TaxID=27915 RepID=A0AAD9KQ10_RIDPI|nr:hypothetical protein NP493_723g02053 [Ridgeia piscesae]